MDDSAKGRYYMILGRYVLTALRINLKCYEHVIKWVDGPLQGSTAPMVDLGAYECKDLNTGNITSG